MDDKVRDHTELLNQLRIDRDETEAGTTPRRLLWSCVAGVVAIGAITAYWLLQPRPIVIKVAVAREVANVTTPGGPSTLDASGYVVARRQATVASKITGKIVEVSIEEGQHVARGQVIARLDNSNARIAYEQSKYQLAEAQAHVTAAQVALDNAEPVFKRSKQMLDKAIISVQTFDTAKSTYDSTATALPIARRSEDVARSMLEAAQQNLDDTIIRAPYDGVVTVKTAQTGEVVSPISAGGGFTRTGICTIVDMDSLELEVEVSENFINRIRVQQPASVKLNAYPDWDIPAEVVAVIPTANRAKATMKVRVGFKVKDPRILPEMGARVSFLSDNVSQARADHDYASAVVVPADAVEKHGDTGVVFVVKDDVVERRVVRLGKQSGDGPSNGRVVLGGVAAGSRVATSNLGVLRDNAAVRIEP